MATGHAQENNHLFVVEETSSPMPAVSSGILLVGDIPEPRPTLECHICMDAPTDPVATSCGHVFCWPCLSQWLQNSLKPCPICRKLLSRNANVLSLHHGAGNAAARLSSRNDSAGTTGEVPGAGNAVVRPRPGNPLLFIPRESGESPESEFSDSMAIIRAIGELVRERARGRSLALERARMKPRLQQKKNELLQRTSDLGQETKHMGEHIAQLERRLALANQQLPAGWSDHT